MRVLTIKIDIFTTTQSLPNKWQLASPHPGLSQPTAAPAHQPTAPPLLEIFTSIQFPGRDESAHQPSPLTPQPAPSVAAALLPLPVPSSGAPYTAGHGSPQPAKQPTKYTPALPPAPAAVPPPAQRRQVRQVAGLHGGEQVAPADRLDPVVPGPHPGPAVEDAAGRNRIDKWGVWQCTLCAFPVMQNIPGCYREIWVTVLCSLAPTCLFTRLEFSLVPAGFLTPKFLQKM